MKIKTHYAKISILVFIILSCSKIAVSQTYVTGGIYANTTWTKANSPYIVIDTVIIFPGYTLTVQPGVIVKFRNKGMLESNTGAINAVGTQIDSIVFTSDSASPQPGSYMGILLVSGTLTSTFSYCSFNYANTALQCADYTNVSHCKFESNLFGLMIGGYGNWTCNNNLFEFDTIGLSGYSANKIPTISYCTCIKNGIGAEIYACSAFSCVFDSNRKLGLSIGGYDTVRNCSINSNGIGLYDYNEGALLQYILRNFIEYNVWGIELANSAFADIFTCNSICNNSAYNVYNTVSNTKDTYMTNNYWCTTDTAKIDSSIYDGYKNYHVGLVFFKPFYTASCADVGPPNAVEGIDPFINTVSVYPNPSMNETTLKIDLNKPTDATVELFDIYARNCMEFSYKLNSGDNNILLNIGKLPAGVYFLKINALDFTASQKLVKVQ